MGKDKKNKRKKESLGHHAQEIAGVPPPVGHPSPETAGRAPSSMSSDQRFQKLLGERAFREAKGEGWPRRGFHAESIVGEGRPRS